MSNDKIVTPNATFKSVQEKRKDLTTTELAEKFGIADLSVNNGLVCCTSSIGEKKWYRPHDAAKLADDINTLAKGFYAQGRFSETIAQECVTLAQCMTAAVCEALRQREESKGTGDVTDTLSNELTPKKEHALDWNGSNRQLDAIVEVASSLFKDSLTVGEVGDIIRMADLTGEEKLGSLKVMADYKDKGRPLVPRAAVGLYRSIRAGQFTPSSSAMVQGLKDRFDKQAAAAPRRRRS